MLTPAQIEARKGKLTASRVAVLMSGGAADIMDLYLEMIGEKTEEDLSDSWPVQFGSSTEPFHLDWLERQTIGKPITRRGEVVTADWAACTLDGWIAEMPCPVEVKHVGGWEPIETIVQRYIAQMHWQMIITGTQQCCFSVIIGAKPPQVEYIPRDQEYGLELWKRGFQFMEFVRRRHPPVALPPVQPPVIPTRIVDMTGNNMWASAAADWTGNRRGADIVKAAEKHLKEMVPADAKLCHGHGIQISVNKAGSKTIKEIA